jgi:hypothetical protein
MSIATARADGDQKIEQVVFTALAKAHGFENYLPREWS